MRLTLLVITAFAASSCSAEAPRTSEKLMDEIERQVRLPQGALPLSQYARHYAFDEDGKVFGVYWRHPSLSETRAAERAPDYGCSEVSLDGDELVGKPASCPKAPEPTYDVEEGSRRWFDDVADLPDPLDGGCDIVTVRFDPSAHRVEQASCNGIG